MNPTFSNQNIKKKKKNRDFVMNKTIVRNKTIVKSNRKLPCMQQIITHKGLGCLGGRGWELEEYLPELDFACLWKRLKPSPCSMSCLADQRRKKFIRVCVWRSCWRNALCPLNGHLTLQVGWFIVLQMANLAFSTRNSVLPVTPTSLIGQCHFPYRD